MYNYTEGDRIWVKATWVDEEHMGHVKEVFANGDAILMFDQWSGLRLKQDGFSNLGLFVITRFISKDQLDSTRRI